MGGPLGVTARALMVQGVSSDAGKSLVSTALCRWLHQRGVRVAPFKAQNMSNNARVVDGGEIGSAQWLQALAAGVAPDVRMNPVLLKPQSDTDSQVVVNGRPDVALSRRPWRGRSAELWPHAEAAYRSLAADYDVIIIEGAGSPAETNLWADDFANMRMADLADAPVLLVADIDRGGAFAHLYGTWALLPAPWQHRLEGFVLNKFRGDAALLEPAPSDLRELTGVPVIGTIPLVDHGLPDEEGPSPVPTRTDGVRISIVCGPCASNLDEFTALQHAASVRFARHPTELDGADLIVLPGSKHTAADADWMRSQGLAHAIADAAKGGTPILGICGGLQLLGRRLQDPTGVEGSGMGLGLLDVDTTYAPTKRATVATIQFGDLPAPWAWLAGRDVIGYEIRHGITTGAATAAATNALDRPAAFVDANILGTTLHGLFEHPEVIRALTDEEPADLEIVFDDLAGLIDLHLETSWIEQRIWT
jgi:adenosylcobyric acid synthase